MGYVYYTQLLKEELTGYDDNESDIYTTISSCIGIFSTLDKAEIRSKKFYIDVDMDKKGNSYFIHIYKIPIDIELNNTLDEKYYVKTIYMD